MIRQRVNLRTPILAYLVRALLIVLALGLFWYGLMIVLLAVKMSPHTVNAISGYRTLYHDAANLRQADFTTIRRLIAGFAGLIAFLLFLYLVPQALPRPYLARSEVELHERELGTTVVKPRAIERVAEFAARGNADVISASGRLGDQLLNVSIGTRRASTAGEILGDVRRRINAELDRHQLPDVPVNVTLTDYVRKTRRELS